MIYQVIEFLQNNVYLVEIVDNDYYTLYYSLFYYLYRYRQYWRIFQFPTPFSNFILKEKPNLT